MWSFNESSSDESYQQLPVLWALHLVARMCPDVCRKKKPNKNTLPYFAIFTIKKVA